MSSRQLDPNLVVWLRELEARVARLEKGDKGVRVNDTRLGDSVLTPNTYTNQIEMKNLKSGSMIPISAQRDVVWSWPDVLAVDPTLPWSPPAVMPDDCVVNEIMIARTDPTGGFNISVVFSTGLTIKMGMADGALTVNRPVHIQLKRNDIAYIGLECADADVWGVSVTLRFGQPTGDEDNHTNTWITCV